MRVFWAKLSKKGHFGHPPKKKKLIDNWKVHFGVFLCFFVFFGGFKGQVKWPFGPPHLALNPPYCFFVFCCCYLFCFGGFKGQVGICFLFVLFVFICFYLFFSCFVLYFFVSLFCSFLCFSLKNLSPPTKVFLVIFECLPLFLLSLFWPPTCWISLSLSLSLSLSCYFLSFFLLVFVFVFLLVPSFCLFLFCFSVFFALVNENNNINIMLQSCFNQSFSFSWVSCLAISFKSLSLIFFFSSDFKLCFLFTMNVFGFRTNKLRKHTFLVKRGVATKFFYFCQPVFYRMWTVIVFGGPFFGKFWLIFKSTVK